MTVFADFTQPHFPDDYPFVFNQSPIKRTHTSFYSVTFVFLAIYPPLHDVFSLEE